MFSCKGPECRKQKVKEYEIRPIAHVKLLTGQSKISCTGQKLKDAYYLFDYQHKTNKQDNGSFYCGTVAARDFLTLTKEKPLELFNPFIEPPRPFNEASDSKWSAEALELYIALHLIIICWDMPIYGRLIKIKRSLEKKPYLKPHYDDVVFINNVIGKDSKKRTLTYMLEELRENNQALYAFQFPRLTYWLNQNKIMSKFEF